MSFTRYTVKTGKHDFRPNGLHLRWGESFAGWYGFFSGRSVYELGTTDQLDYNKFAGWSFSPFTNHRDAAMLGWRYAFARDGWEVTPYYHVRSKRVIPNSAKPLALVKKGQTFAFWLEVLDWEAGTVRTHLETENAVLFTHEQDGLDLYAFRSWPWPFRCPRDIGAWFGGTSAAPVDLELYAQEIKEWQMDDDGKPARPRWNLMTN